MDSLEHFLSNQVDEEESVEPQESDQQIDDMDDNEKTFGDKLGYNEQETYDAIKTLKRFDKSLENRYYKSMINSNKSHKSNNDSLLHRIHSYKYKKSSIGHGGGPLETKIHKTPLSKKAKYRKTSNDDNKFESRDPRFMKKDINEKNKSNESGWKLRNAYKFLDDMIDRDINIIKKEIKKNKNDIKTTKKTARDLETGYNRNIEIDIKRKGVAINTLKTELITLQNRKNRIKEKDLEQRSKSQMRKMEIDQVSKGIKTPYHHKLQRTRFGKVKWVKNDRNNNNMNTPRINIQNVYLENKYNELKKDGKLEKYIKKKTRRINSKFRAALKKKSGRGWNDTV